MLALYREYKMRRIFGESLFLDEWRTSLYRAWVCWRIFGDPDLPLTILFSLVAVAFLVLTICS